MAQLTFLNADGNEIIRTISYDISLEDATIEGTNIAELHGWELVAVDN